MGMYTTASWIHLVEGSGSNVVGLPMERLERMLAKLTTMRHENPGADGQLE